MAEPQNMALCSLDGRNGEMSKHQSNSQVDSTPPIPPVDKVVSIPLVAHNCKTSDPPVGLSMVGESKCGSKGFGPWMLVSRKQPPTKNKQNVQNVPIQAGWRKKSGNRLVWENNIQQMEKITEQEQNVERTAQARTPSRDALGGEGLGSQLATSSPLPDQPSLMEDRPLDAAEISSYTTKAGPRIENEQIEVEQQQFFGINCMPQQDGYLGKGPAAKQIAQAHGVLEPQFGTTLSSTALSKTVDVDTSRQPHVVHHLVVDSVDLMLDAFTLVIGRKSKKKKKKK